MYSLDEIGILPSSTPTDIKHRGDINPFDENGKLPVFVSPMTCILNADNFGRFVQSKAIPIYPVRMTEPRALPVSNWIAYTLEEVHDIFLEAGYTEMDEHQYILIDTAQGHMKELYDTVRELKRRWGEYLTVMVGNIAHPEIYRECCNAGVDYVRIGIGGGNGCSTSCLTGIHASIPWLLEGIKGIQLCRRTMSMFCTKVVADGGIDTIDKAVKCLALGADYVMMGKLFAQCKEAADGQLGWRPYYGQASEQGQIDRFGEVKRAPEGIETIVECRYTLDEFLNKFEAALRSSMSYTDSHNLNEFRQSKWMLMSEHEFKSFYKKNV